MHFRRCWLAVAFALAAAVTASAAVPDGNYTIGYAAGPIGENYLALLKLTTKDGKTEAEVLSVPRPKLPANAPARPAPKVTVGAVKVEKNLITIPVNNQGATFDFEGVIDSSDPKVISGSFLINKKFVYRGSLTATDKSEFKEGEVALVVKAPDDYQALTQARSGHVALLNQAAREKDAEKKKELQDKAKAVKAEGDEKVPGLLTAMVESHSNDLFGYYSTIDILALLKKTNSKPADVKKWTDNAIKMAAKFGPRFETNAYGQLAEALSAQKGFGEILLPLAEKYVAATAKAELGEQYKAQKTLAIAYEQLGKADLLKETTAKVASIDMALDDEYHKTVPPFKPEAFAGRKDKEANRVVVFELFTGAQCPPCVAADVAFDALETAYSSKDLVMVQYHMHIPGPDPMHNPDSAARWDYYGKKRPGKMGGVPSALFNGKPTSTGGGGMDNSKSKFNEYTKIIDPLLELKSDVSIKGSATLAGGAVSVGVTVDKLPDGAKVLVLLTEDEVKYPGGNGIRFHHQVVRSMFGKPDGFDAKGGKVEASVKVADLKADLTKYLDEYTKDGVTFRPNERPLGLEKLKVIVIIQGEDGEVLQGGQFDITGGKS